MKGQLALFDLCDRCQRFPVEYVIVNEDEDRYFLCHRCMVEEDADEGD